MIKSIERTKESLDSLIDRTHDAVIGATERAERGVEFTAERTVTGTQAAGKSVRDSAESASSGAHRRVEGAAEAVDRGYAKVRNDLTRAATATTDYLAENPGKALLIAASVGFAVGMLARKPRQLA